MTELSRASADTDHRPRRPDAVGRAVLPLWVAALSLAVAATVSSPPQ